MRVRKPGSVFVADIFRGYDEGQVPREFESMAWPTARSLAEKLAAGGAFTLEAERSPAPHGDPDWPQFVLRK